MGTGNQVTYHSHSIQRTKPQPKVGKKIKKYVLDKILQQKEDKAFEVALFNPSAAQWANGTGLVFMMSNVPQGDDVGTREGLETRLMSVEARYGVQTATPYVFATGVQSSMIFRVIIFVDKECNGVLPIPSQVLTTVAVFSPYNPINHLNNPRFKILSDTVDTINLARPEFFRVIRRKINLNNKFLGNGTTIGNIGKNGLFCLIVASDTAAYYTAMNGFSRFQFTTYYQEK